MGLSPKRATPVSAFFSFFLSPAFSAGMFSFHFPGILFRLLSVHFSRIIARATTCDASLP